MREKSKSNVSSWASDDSDDLFDEYFIPWRFAGQYSDEELSGDIYYNRFRYYDPQLGQYITQDPIGLAGGNPTLYGYVGDTNTWIDPFGLAKCEPRDRGGLRKAMLAENGGQPPFAGAQAHHGLPWNFKKWFAEKDLNVNDTKHGDWVQGGGNGGHQSWSAAYNKIWKDFKSDFPDATQQQMLDFFNSIKDLEPWGPWGGWNGGN